jgi:hypothetical protein
VAACEPPRYYLSMNEEDKRGVAPKTLRWKKIPEYGRLRTDRYRFATECLLRYVDNLNAHAKDFKPQTAAGLKYLAAAVAAEMARSHEHRLAGVRRSSDIHFGTGDAQRPVVEINADLTSQGNVRVSIASADQNIYLPLTWPEEYGRQQRPDGELIWLKGVGWLFEEERWGWEKHEVGRQAFVDLGTMVMTAWYQCVADVGAFFDVHVRSQIAVDRRTGALEQILTPFDVDRKIEFDSDITLVDDDILLDDNNASLDDDEASLRIRRTPAPMPGLFRLIQRIKRQHECSRGERTVKPPGM